MVYFLPNINTGIVCVALPIYIEGHIFRGTTEETERLDMKLQVLITSSGQLMKSCFSIFMCALFRTLYFADVLIWTGST